MVFWIASPLGAQIVTVNGCVTMGSATVSARLLSKPDAGAVVASSVAAAVVASAVFGVSVAAAVGAAEGVAALVQPAKSIPIANRSANAKAKLRLFMILLLISPCLIIRPGRRVFKPVFSIRIKMSK